MPGTNESSNAERSASTAQPGLSHEVADLARDINIATARGTLHRRMIAITLGSAAIIVGGMLGLAADEDRASIGYVIAIGLATTSLFFALAAFLVLPAGNVDPEQSDAVIESEQHAVVLTFVIAFAGFLAALVATILTLT